MKSLERNFGVHFNDIMASGQTKQTEFDRIWKQHTKELTAYNGEVWQKLTVEQVSANAFDMAVINGTEAMGFVADLGAAGIIPLHSIRAIIQYGVIHFVSGSAEGLSYA